VEGHDELALEDGWEAADCPPDAYTDPSALGRLEWLPARVPGTAAAVLHAAGRWRPGDHSDLDARDWWFRTRFHAPPVSAGEEVALELGGVATIAEVFLNGAKLLDSDSMFAAHTLDAGPLLREENELAIRCRALAPLLRERRKPRARWRTRLVDGNLRFFRTMLLGRAPGFAPDPAAVGPWRAVRLVRRRTVVVEELALHPRLEGDGPDAAGLLSAHVLLRSLDRGPIAAVELELEGPSGTHRAELALTADETGTGTPAGNEGATVLARGTLRVPAVARWWPHTHGRPCLHEVRLIVRTATGAVTARAGRIGFRTLSAGARANHDVEVDGLDLHVNGVRVFARGAVWTPADPVGLAPARAALRTVLERARDAGMNMLRIPGTSAYESSAFHDLCDELGLLVWQDFMFANLDYPLADERFRASVEREVTEQLGALAGRPSLAVLCGNSEIEQQVAMLGLDPALGRGVLFGELLPRLIAEAQSDAIYVPSAPCGGALPFRPDRGIANYYGVGGYRRPLQDARRAEVRFAAECLAFSNVPDEAGVEAVLPEAPSQVVVHHPRWKAGVPRDAGTGWDFEDVRDHYFELLLGIDPSELRRVDHERYLELSRALTGETMAEVFGEWRRAGSPCGGGLVLWLKDLAPGAGWGVLDFTGAPKPSYHHLRRALAPVAVWMTDEGLGGIVMHVANDRPGPLTARLRVALYRDLEHRVDEAHETITLEPHGTCERDVEQLIGRFADVAWAYRFGPPAQDLLVASLEQPGDPGVELLSQALRFPAGRPTAAESGERLGLHVTAQQGPAELVRLSVRSKRLAYGVRVHVPGYIPDDDAFSVEPGGERIVLLRARATDTPFPGGSLSAVNLQGRIHIAATMEDA
jgi:beta-mannosidase